MRCQPWKQFLHLRTLRTPTKLSKFFEVNSIFSRFYNAAKPQSREVRKRQLEKYKTHARINRITKRRKQEKDKKEKINAFVKLSRRYDELRAEQKHLEKQIKNRTTVLIKAVYRHKKSMKKLDELERTLATYSEELKQAVSNNVLRGVVAHSLNGETTEVNYNKLQTLRRMGGSDLNTEFYSDIMPDIIRKYTAVRKYGNRWMQKANIKRHNTVMDIASIIKKQQRMSWDPTAKLLRETIAMQTEEIVPTMTNEQYEREIALRSHSVTSVFHNINSYPNVQKITESLKSLLDPSEVVVASEESSKLPKQRKRLKTKQSATSNIDESSKRHRTGKRRGRARRRSSRKSQQSTTSDGLKKGQRKRKGKRKSIKSIDSGGQDMKLSRSGRKSRKRYSKEKSKLSKISQGRGSRAEALQSVDDEKIGKESLLLETKLLQQMVPAQIKKGSVDRKTTLDKFKRKSVELEKPQSDTNYQFRALEEYWGVPLRTDSTLEKLERLNSILDELIVEERKKPPPPRKHANASRNVAPKPSKRERHDLEKLLVLLKECKQCQKKQEKAKTAERDFAVLCQKEYNDAIRNAAGLPDYFPEDSDFSLICSCNSLT